MEVRLKVMEALQEEAYKGIVRIDSQTMRELGVRPGDIVEIEGGKKTVGIIDRAYPTDVGQQVIRMDGVLRRNAKTGLGEIVKVRKAKVSEAKAITIAPTQKGIMVQADPFMFKKGLLGRAVVKGDQVALGGAKRRRRTFEGSPFEDIFDLFEQDFGGGFGLGRLKFIVANTNPKGNVIVTENTHVSLNPKAIEVLDEKVVDVTYEDIGGLTDEIKKIREMVELPLKHPEVFERLGIQPPKGVLLHGSPGTGKTLLAKAVANETSAHFMHLAGPEIMGKFVGEAEKRIRDIFEEAAKNAPSIIFIDEIDAIAPKREESYGEVERRVVGQLLAVMDGLKSRGKVIVISATNRPNSLDPALRRPGRFDREIEIGVPKYEGRLQILNVHTRNMPMKGVDLKEIARITHGFVGADLEMLCKEAAMVVLRRLLPKFDLGKKEEVPKDLLEKLIITKGDFKEALKLVRPSALREVFVDTPNTNWDDIGGLENVKQELKEAVEWPLKSPEMFKRLGVKAPKGILMFGPPGTGKTLLAKAVAHESEANFILVNGPELLNKFVGESEKGIRKVFEKARQASPSIVFFDEIDAIASRRGRNIDSGVTERMVNQLLTEIDGLQELNDCVIIAATNRPDIIDPALLRPGRFDRIIFTPVPNEKARKEIFKVHTKEMPLSKDIKVDVLVKNMENFVGADIESFCREAAIIALRKDPDAKEVTMKDFEDAMRKIKGSITKEAADKYEDIEDEYLRTARSNAIRENYFG